MSLILVGVIVFASTRPPAETSSNNVASPMSPSSAFQSSHPPSSQRLANLKGTRTPVREPSMEPTASTLPSVSAQDYIVPSETPWPSMGPSDLPQPSMEPSDPPTPGPPECPDDLPRSIALNDEKGLLMLRYGVVGLPDVAAAGLLCLSLEYAGTTPAGWLGLAFTTATRDPQFGRKEAVIGLPGVLAAVPVLAERDAASIGQQSAAALGKGIPVPIAFANPGKYEIPAGGGGRNGGYHGPSLSLLRGAERQTLVNGTVSSAFSAVDPNYETAAVQVQLHTARISFGKYLHEPGEIKIDPFQSNLLLYAVSSVDVAADHGDKNPKWRYTSLKFLESSATDVSRLDLVRTRKRDHEAL